MEQKKRRLTTTELGQVKKLLEAGKRPVEIAKLLNITTSVASYYNVKFKRTASNTNNIQYSTKKLAIPLGQTGELSLAVQQMEDQLLNLAATLSDVRKSLAAMEIFEKTLIQAASAIQEVHRLRQRNQVLLSNLVQRASMINSEASLVERE